ncbi:MAG: hypothetical protein KatS3mg102_1900 [Planctomycetota bacterium]|nr:MAG: hypothetical protein KatS3mg102_1900 [Planctomycetota bacterium]
MLDTAGGWGYTGDMRPQLFEIPGLGWPVYAYPSLVAVGVAVAVFAAMRMARRRGIDPVLALDLGLIGLVSALFGGHLFYYAEFYHKHFAERPWYAALFFWEGGLVFYGAVLAAFGCGMAYVAWWNRRARMAGRPAVPMLRMVDIGAAAVPVGLVFGRLGCLLNGCCWGRVCELGPPLAVRFPAGSLAWQRQLEQGQIGEQAAHSLPVYATQLYEAGFAAVLALVLWRYWRRRPRDGRVVAACMALYGGWRLFVEQLRSHDAQAEMTRLLGSVALTWSQVVSLGMIVSGAMMWLVAGWLAPRPELHGAQQGCPSGGGFA